MFFVLPHPYKLSFFFSLRGDNLTASWPGGKLDVTNYTVKHSKKKLMLEPFNDESSVARTRLVIN